MGNTKSSTATMEWTTFTAAAAATAAVGCGGAGGYGGAAEESYNGLFLARPDEAAALRLLPPPPVASLFCWRMSRGP